MISQKEKNGLEFLLKHKKVIYFIIITALFLFIRVELFEFKSFDYNSFLSLWYVRIKKLGGLSALRKQVGNYSIPYQFLIAIATYIPIKNLYMYKVLSILFDFVTAFSGAKLIQSMDKKVDFLLPYTLILALPTVIFNSALWAQADAIYTGLMIISLWMLYQRKYTLAFVFLGFALAFKLQAIFIVPFYLLLYLIRKDFSILYFFVTFVSFYVSNIPGFIYGRGFLTPFKVYLDQSSTYEHINMNFPNFTSIMNFNVTSQNTETYQLVHSFLILFTLIVLIVGYMFVLKHQESIKIDGQAFLLLAIWTFWSCVMFLPGMHDRYGFFVDIFLVIAALEERKIIPVAFITVLGSTLAYSKFLFGMIYNFNLISYLIIIAYVYFTFFIVFNLKNENIFVKSGVDLLH